MRAYHYRIPVEGIDGKPAALPATARQSGTSGSYEITVNGLSIAELTRIKAATGHPLHVGIVERVRGGCLDAGREALPRLSDVGGGGGGTGPGSDQTMSAVAVTPHLGAPLPHEPVQPMTAVARLVAVHMRWCDIAGSHPAGPGWQMRLVIARPDGQVMRGWRLRRWADGGGWRLYRYDLADAWDFVSAAAAVRQLCRVLGERPLEQSSV